MIEQFCDNAVSPKKVSPSRTPAKRWLLAGILTVITGAVAVAALFGYRSVSLSQIPDIGPPFQSSSTFDERLLSENAFPYYDAVQLTERPNGHNPEPFSVYGSDEDTSAGEPEKEALSLTLTADELDEWRAWHEANQSQLPLIRKAAQFDFAAVCLPMDQDYATVMSSRHQRAIRCLALLEADRQLSLDYPDAAWKWLRVGFRQSRHVGMYGTHVDRNTGWAFHVTVTAAMLQWASFRNVDHLQLEQALRHVREDYQLTPLPSESLRLEYYFEANTFDPFVDKNGNFERNYAKEWLNHEPERSWRLMNLMFANWKQQVDLPLHQQQRLPNSQFGLFVNSTTETDSIAAKTLEQLCRSSIPIANMLRYNRSVPGGLYREQARQHFLEVGLSAQIHFRKHRRFPESSSEFESTPLGTWPSDPMCNQNRPLGYLVSKDGLSAIAYCIGYDGDDDGGQIDLHPRDEGYDLGIHLLSN